MKTVYAFHAATGQYLGPLELTADDLSPLEPGVYLMPGGCTDIAPPAASGSNRAIWTGDHWQLVEEPASAIPPAPVPPTEEQAAQALQAAIVSATQARLDAFAQTRAYDGILSACTYAASSVPRFAAEGQCAVDVRDATWSALYQLLADVQAGARPMPAGFADVEPLLPALAWPV